MMMMMDDDDDDDEEREEKEKVRYTKKQNLHQGVRKKQKQVIWAEIF